MLSHPPYSPDFAPSDLPFISFHAELLMIKLLMYDDVMYDDTDDVKSHLIQFSAGKNQKFHEHETMTLPERWQKVTDKNGQYLIE